MRTLRFIHCADLHIDSPFKGLASLDTELASNCREATFQAFKSIVDIALEKQVDFVTIGGDVYDSSEKSLRAAVFFRDQLKRLAQEDINVYIVAGNHDPLDDSISPLRFPDNVHFFGSRPECASFLKNGVEIAQVHGISFQTARVEENLALQLKPKNDLNFSIGLLHCNVSGQSGHENYAPCAFEDLARSGMDAWCLGHVHTYNVLSESRPLVVYPGNPQGRHINESGSRGCTLIEVDELKNISTQFIPAHRVRWEKTEIEISDLEDIDSLLERMDNQLYSIAEGGSEDLVVIRVLWHGRGPLHSWLSSRKPEELRIMLQERLEISRPSLCIESQEFSTRPPVDRNNLLLQESFLGDFLRLVEEARRGGPTLNTIIDSLSELYENRLCRRFLTDDCLADALKGDQKALQTLLDEAETLALDHLTREQD